MSLTQESPEALQEEKQIQQDIFDAIDSYQNIIFNAGAGAGKTLNSINLALLFARNDKKTILIDCDLRKPMIHKVLDLKQEPGLTNVLINKVDILKAVQPIMKKNISVLTCGLLPPNPSDLLNSKKMQDVLNYLKDHYDIIILDVPPILPVTDAIILGSKTDGLCLVVRSENTNRDAILKTKKILDSSGIKITGVILNDVNYKNVYGYYKDYYYYSAENKKK